MKLAIFGATGRTGRPLVQQALEAGHEVVALARRPEALPIQHERLTVIQGDAMNVADVEKTVQGADAVISVLGHSKDTPREMQAVALRHIVAAMKKYGVRRLVDLTGAGVRTPEDRPKLVDRLMVALLKAISGAVLQDGINHVAVIRESGLEWVVVRVPRLMDGPRTGTYRVGWVGVNSGTRINRADVADFLLKQATTDTTYLHQMPMVSA